MLTFTTLFEVFMWPSNSFLSNSFLSHIHHKISYFSSLEYYELFMYCGKDS
jgi:hypothetical protein